MKMKRNSFIALLFILLLIASIAGSELDTTGSDDNSAVYDKLRESVRKEKTVDDWDVSENLEKESQSTNTTEKILAKQIALEMIRLTWGILGFGLFLIVFIGFIALKKNTEWDRELTRMITVLLVIIAGLVLITAGYNDQQIAPMFGLLGTMVGYILGKSSPSGEASKKGQ
jgi:hypothetical protein